MMGDIIIFILSVDSMQKSEKAASMTSKTANLKLSKNENGINVRPEVGEGENNNRKICSETSGDLSIVQKYFNESATMYEVRSTSICR